MSLLTLLKKRVSFINNSLPPEGEPYQRQMTSYRRTRSAILEGAKSLIAKQGLHKTSMIEIADESEVSRATLYNHFRDKPSVLRALLESEVARVFTGALEQTSPNLALQYLAEQISLDTALAKMRISDPGAITNLLVDVGDPLRTHIETGLYQLFSSSSQMIERWLIGQALRPLNVEQIAIQSIALTRI